MSNWPVAALVVIAIMLFRWEGQSWRETLRNVAVLVAGSCLVVVVVILLMAWLW